MINVAHIIASGEAHDYHFWYSDKVMSFTPAIVGVNYVCDDNNPYLFRRRDEHLALTLLDRYNNHYDFVFSPKLIQLYRTMLILAQLSHINNHTVRDCYLLASRQFSDEVRDAVKSLERSGVDALSIQTAIFSQTIEQNTLHNMIQHITEACVRVNPTELMEEIGFNYIPNTMSVQALMAKSF